MSEGATGSRLPGTLALDALALVAFGVYAIGAAAGPHPYDVGELAAAAALLGGSHPPGQPLHALLGHAAALVPLGPIVLRLSLLSSAGAAMAAWAAGRAVLAWSARGAATTRIDVAIAAAVTLAVALLPCVIRSAMRPEVYTLALACVTGSAWALAARHHGTTRGGLGVAAVLAGLAFALHPPHAIAIALMGLVACAARRPSRRELAVASALGVLVSVGLTLYLPLRAHAGASCWGDPTTASGLWAYVSGAAYQRNLGAHGSAIEHVLVALRYALIQGGGAALVGAPLALRGPIERTAWGMSVVALAAALVQPLEERNPDNVAYYAPALALGLVALGASLARAATEPARSTPALAGAMATPLVPFACSALAGLFVSADLPVLETLAFETASAPAPRALLVVRTDFVAGAAMQSRDVDGLRPDLAIFVEGLATSSWHWRALAGHPPFDGAPHLGHGEAPREAYVGGAIALAHDQVEIAVERAGAVGGRGVVRGALLVRPIGPLVDGVDDASMAERTMGAIASTLAWAGEGDHEAGAQVLRNVMIERAPLLVARGRGERASRELAAAAGRSLPTLEPGPLSRAPSLLVRDHRFFLASREDVVRVHARLLAAGGRALEATSLLEAQAERGDDRALLQLAAIQLDDGLVDPARAALDAYASAHVGDPDAELDTLEVLRAALSPRRIP
jgi:hypothetical protein